MFRYFVGFLAISLTMACVEAPPTSSNPLNNANNSESNNSTNNSESNNSTNNSELNNPTNNFESNNSQSNNSTNNSESNNSNNPTNNDTNNLPGSCVRELAIPGKMNGGDVQIDKLDDVVLFAGRFSEATPGNASLYKFGLVRGGSIEVFPWGVERKGSFDVALKTVQPLAFDLAVTSGNAANGQIEIYSCGASGCTSESSLLFASSYVHLFRNQVGLVVIHQDGNGVKVSQLGGNYQIV